MLKFPASWESHFSRKNSKTHYTVIFSAVSVFGIFGFPCFIRFYACLFGRKKEQIDVLFVGAEERDKWAMLVEFNEETLLFIRKKVLSKNLAQIDDSFF
uniref:Uncharacterized protein n=1 Tax=Gossypium raimondii TaxID=29730 RepID=A0A0D2PYK3_GOSRA|nr:hypothetical protein B456_002G000200 [Gossypium raimondii]